MPRQSEARATARFESARWRHAIITPQFNTAFQHMPLVKGFYRDYGIELELVNLQNDANISRALLAGEVDSAEFGTAAGILAVGRAPETAKMLGSFQHGLPLALFARPNVRRVQDLAGKRIGVSAVGGLPHNLALGLLAKYNIDPAAVEFVPLQQAGGTFVQALLADKIDATITGIEFQRTLESSPEIQPVVLVSKELPRYIRLAWYVTARNLRERPDVTRRVLYGAAKGIRYAMAHREETVALATELTSGQAEAMAYTFDQYQANPEWLDLNFRLEPEAIAYMQDFNLTIGMQERRFPVEQILITEYQEAVVRELGAV